MERVLVESSNIESVGYDNYSETLELEFKNKHIYQFFGVPPSIHNKLVNAESVGRTFNETVRNKFNFKKVL